MSKVTVVIFPGNSQLAEVEFEGETLPLSDVLARANATPGKDEKCDLAVNGTLVTDLVTPVPNGAIVTKTKRVEGA